MKPCLYETTYKFLLKNKLNPFFIPCIDELGNYAGGYMLVKRIHYTEGGLRLFRKNYANYLWKEIYHHEN